MWLQYGVDPQNGFLVSVELMRRGKTPYLCPYCRGELIAKKGDILVHHLAHIGETCRSVVESGRNLPTLPLYDHFHLHLPPTQFNLLRKLWQQYGVEDRDVTRESDISELKWRGLHNKGLLKKKVRGLHREHISYSFTPLGKIPFGEASLKDFNEIQEQEIHKKLHILTSNLESCFQHTLVILPEALIDLKIYRAQIQRILSLRLYFLKIDGDNLIFYKIGVTRRSIQERVAEIEAELKQHFHHIKLKVRGIWEHRGNLELYFKYRYQSFQHCIGNLTEYYQFDADELKTVLADLKRVPPKVLSEEETAILKGHPSSIEQQIEAEQQHYFAEEKLRRRSHAIRTGMSRAKHWGQHVGRPPGTEETPEHFLTKRSTQAVVEALQKNLSLRQTAADAGVSVNTVRKVKAALEQHPD